MIPEAAPTAPELATWRSELGNRATKGASPVRILARRYADGLVDRRAYIVERRRLLDAIAAGQLELPAAPMPADGARRPMSPPSSSLGEEDDTVELRLRQSVGKIPDEVVMPVTEDLSAATPDLPTAGTSEVLAEPVLPPPAHENWWMVAALLTGLLGVAVWLWWQLSPL